jgi:hypothetical protein
VLSNPLLLGGIGIRGAVRRHGGLPAPNAVDLRHRPLPAWALVLLLPMPLLVWGVDETFRAWRRRAIRT